MKINILFYGKWKVKTFYNSLPIYFRVTINRLHFETTTNRFVDPAKWSSVAGKVKGNTEEARRVIFYLDQLRQEAFEIERVILYGGRPFNIYSFKEQ